VIAHERPKVAFDRTFGLERLCAPSIGIAHSPYTSMFVKRFPGAIDYVELAYEQILSTPSAADVADEIQVVLHSASLSMAEKDRRLLAIEGLSHWIQRTRTPWLGEHLAFAQARSPRKMKEQPAFIDVGYTVNPCLNMGTLETVVSRLLHAEARLTVPVLLENGPIYFEMPGSTMSQAQFFSELCERTQAFLLLDLAHLYVSAKNSGSDPFKSLLQFPLHRVVEIHISGAKESSGIWWDDHSVPVPDVVFDLLATAMTAARPTAITLEYNWVASLHGRQLLDLVDRARSVAGCAR
jgi:uncharacterized protein (UPF0276 family)